jgi:hypothetical protein
LLLLLVSVFLGIGVVVIGGGDGGDGVDVVIVVDWCCLFVLFDVGFWSRCFPISLLFYPETVLPRSKLCSPNLKTTKTNWVFFRMVWQGLQSKTCFSGLERTLVSE